MIGALLTGVFATTVINRAGANGALFGNVAQLGKQAIAVGATLGYSFVASLVICFVVDKLVGLRCTEDEELTGLDLSQHAEVGYSFAETGMTTASVPAGHGASEPGQRAPDRL
jgi:Amt family ammonium transporter